MLGCTLLSQSLRAEVVISEIMPCNVSSLLNDQWDYTGWVELYNSGTSSVNLRGSIFNQYKKKGSLKWTWIVDYDFTIAAGAYKVIYFDKLNQKDHSPYKVDSDGGKLELITSLGTSSMITYPIQYPHLSYGQSNGVEGYMEPTPLATNSEAYESLADSRCQTPTFSGVTPGVYRSATGSISMNCATSGASIYYTKDGSEPTPKNGILYEEPIKFDKTRVLRARAYKEGYLSSEIVTNSFILYGPEHKCEGEEAAVVSIVADDKYFYSNDLGIYVKGSNGIAGPKSCISERANYNRDWKRPVNFEYFEEGSQKISAQADVSVMGGCSRTYDVKTLKITTSKKFGAEIFGYNAFYKDENKVDNQYASYQLRNGGNEYSGIRVRDAFIQSIAKGMKNIDYQAYEPVAYYLNGEYLGLMGLRDRTNKEFVFSNYGLSEDEIDLLEIDQKSVSASSGDMEAYDRMIDFVKANNQSENFLSLLNSHMDVEEYLNYIIFEQFIVNTDWPGNNTKLWRKKEGGHFRWILYDTDFGFGLFSGYPNYSDEDRNMIDWCMGRGSASNWANGDPDSYAFNESSRWKTILYASLMANEQFQKRYLTQSLMHLSNTLTYDRIEAVWDSIVDRAESEYCATFPHTNLRESGVGMLRFAKSRCSNVYKHLASFFDLENKKVPLHLSTTQSGAGFFVNGVNIKEKNYSFNGLQGMDLQISADLPDGYTVDYWLVGTEKYSQSDLSLKLAAETTVKLVAKQESSTLPLLFINEVCAKNTYLKDESGNTGDWIEIYNAGDTPVDVAGMYLSDNVDEPMLHKIERGYAETVIPAKGYLLLWADDHTAYAPLHVGFKLSDVSGETLTLSKVVGGKVVTIDQLTFPSMMGENVSYGRAIDGTEEYRTFDFCVNGMGMEATPGSANGVNDCDAMFLERATLLTLNADDERIRFLLDDEMVEPGEHYVMKGIEHTIIPVLPTGFQFVKWESSKPYLYSEAFMTNTHPWRYHYADSIPGTTWMAANFDDSKWEKGTGRFGYAKGSRMYDTPLDYGPDADSKYLTSYFRTDFTIDLSESFDSLLLSLVYDDGAAIYLNGEELGRYNLPKTALSYKTLAIDYIDDLKATLSLPKSSLKDGKNVLAVEMHQNNASSSDMTFAMTATRCGMTNYLMDATLSIVPTEAMTFSLSSRSATNVVADDSADDELMVGPNPAKEFVYISSPVLIKQVTLVGALGKVYARYYPWEKEAELDLPKLTEGMYLLQVETENGLFVKKLMIR